MRKSIFLTQQLLIAALVLPVCAEDSKSPWIPLFDGESTKGWTPRAEVTKFEAVDDELHLVSDVNVWVTSDLKLADFIVEAEVMLPPADARKGFNSGLAFRCTGETGKPKGYQLEIDLAKPGGVYGIGLGGWLYPGKDQGAEYKERVADAFKPAEWNLLRVECRGPKIKTFINGKLVADFEDSQSLEGYFGIQHHGKGGLVKFRNLRAKKL
ncbi:MAG: hypothetical protein ACI8UO_001982 [Verrucomicrobiales bacterium]